MADPRGGGGGGPFNNPMHALYSRDVARYSFFNNLSVSCVFKRALIAERSDQARSATSSVQSQRLQIEKRISLFIPNRVWFVVG